MPSLQRPSFAKGWQPDADPVGGPPDALLRMDNLVLDQLGTLALRQGSAIISTPGADVHSLYTAILNGTRLRFVGSGNQVVVNGSALTAMAGANDVTFGSYLGQVVFGRSTSAFKYDGTTLRNWGIAMTGGVPTVVATAPDGLVLATGHLGEIPAFIVTEGAATSFATGFDGTANGAVVLTPDPNTHRGVVYRKAFAPVNATAYTGGAVGSDDDILTLWVYVAEPANLFNLTIMIDVNPSAPALFQTDYYTGTFTQDEASLLNTLNPAFTVSGAGHPQVLPVPTGLPFSLTAGSTGSLLRFDPNVWTKLAIRRGDLLRVGSTAGCDWRTVNAMQVVVTTAQVTPTPIPIDQVALEVANAIGPHRWAYVYAFNSGSYVGLSAPSAFSAPLQLQAAGAVATVPADASRDPQVNEIWLYRWALNNYYRTAVHTGVSGTGAVTIPDVMGETDALAADLVLEPDNGPPPPNILAIAGPYYDRLFVLTTTSLALSRPINLDSFATSQVVWQCGVDERAYWLKKTFGGLYVGTSKDVYRIDGTAADLPDGSIDVVVSPLSINHPPASGGVAQDGNLLVYLASDGWRSIGAAGSISLVGATSLLYAQQLTRHGVGPVNIASGRFRAAIRQQQLAAITPEGGSTTSSAVIYRHAPVVGSWYRHTYPTSFRSLYVEPDGTLLAGDAAGAMWQVDTGTTDNGGLIPLTIWTHVDDDQQPFLRKDPIDVRWSLDTGGAACSAALHLDNASTPTVTIPVTASGLTVVSASLSDQGAEQPAFRQVQLRLTGSVSVCRIASWGLRYTLHPPMFRGQLKPTDQGDPHLKTISGFQLRLCTLGQTRQITPVIDGVALPSLAITTSVDNPLDVTYTCPAAIVATQYTINVDGEVELYSWVPLVTVRRPLGVCAWDSGPLNLGTQELVWLRRLFLKVRAQAPLTIVPWFDGVAFPAVVTPTPALPNVDTVWPIDVGRAYVGRQPRLVVTSPLPFYPYAITVVRRTSGTVTDKGAQVIPVPINPNPVMPGAA